MQIPSFGTLFKRLNAEINKIKSLDNRGEKELEGRITDVFSKNMNFDELFNVAQALSSKLVEISCVDQKSSILIQKLKDFTVELFIKEVVNEQLNCSDQEAFVAELLKITNETARVVAIKSVIDRKNIRKNDYTNAKWIVVNIDQLKITQTDTLLQIALQCAEKVPQDVAENIDKFEIKDQRSLADIALICLEEKTKCLIKNIEKFKINDEKILLEIALECASKDANFTVKEIDKFKITDQKNLGDIALACLQKSPEFIIENIDEFKINDEKILVEIALQCAIKDVENLIRNIGKFKIKNEQSLASIACKCADSLDERNIYFLLDKINNFQINDQQCKVKVVLQCAEKAASSVADFINDLNITQQKDLVEIALKCAEKDSMSLRENIQKFKIEDQAGLLEIAIKCAEKNTADLAAFIIDFNITQPKDLVKVALKCAETKPESLIESLDNFKIEDKSDLISIALKCVGKVPNNVLAYISAFKIEDQAGLVKMALKCAEKDPKYVSSNISAFKIEDQAGLVEIALKCAGTDSESLLEHINAFKINDEQSLIKIALRCAEKVPNEVVENLDKFKINDEKILLEIAIKCAEKFPSYLVGKIGKIKIPNQRFIELFLRRSIETVNYAGLEGCALYFDRDKVLELLDSVCKADDETNLLLKLNATKLLNSCENFLKLLYENKSNPLIAEFLNDEQTSLMLQTHPKFMDVSDSFYSDATYFENISKASLEALRAVSKLSGTQQLDIPDVDIGDTDPYSYSMDHFNTFSDEDLTGIISLAEKTITPKQHRENFKYFLDIVKNKTLITGLNTKNVDKVYKPLIRILKHLVLKILDLPKEEALSLLTQFSYIDKEKYCIDPYLKSALFVYNMLKEGSTSAVSTQTSEEQLRDNLRARLLVTRDNLFNVITKNTLDRPIDTHSENWVKNKLSEVAGYEINNQDIYLAHGYQRLVTHLGKANEDVSQESIAEELMNGFQKRFFAYSLDSFSKGINLVLNQQNTPTSLDASAAETKEVTSETVVDMFHTALDDQFATFLNNEKKDLKNPNLVDQYVNAILKLPSDQKKQKQSEAKKTLWQKRLDASLKKSCDPDDPVDRSDTQNEMKEKIVKYTNELADLEAEIQKKISAIEIFEKDLGESKCKSLKDLIENKAEIESKFTTEWFVEEDIIDPETNEIAMDENYMPISSFSITLEGFLKFFELYLDFEKRNAQRAQAL